MGISMVYMGQMVGFEKIQGNYFFKCNDDMDIYGYPYVWASRGFGSYDELFFWWEGGEGRKWERKSNGHTYGLKVVIL